LRILVAGDGHSELHERPVITALRELGHDARGFLWHDYFKPAAGTFGRLLHPLLRAQDKFVRGPAISQLNADLVRGEP